MMFQDKNPLVSIIIPVYNGSNFLDRAINSALNQVYKNIEIIVINDGSNDNGKTRNIALGYGSKIKYFEKENGGVSSSFNFGISKMSGEYFSWLSHDDEYYPDKIKDQIDTYRTLNFNLVVLFANTDYIDGDSNLILSESISRIKNVNTKILQLQMLIKRPLINGNTVLIPKNCFNKVGLFNEKLRTSQDYDMWFRLADYYPFHFINKPLVKTRIHQFQGSKNINTFLLESCSTKKKLLNSLNEDKLLSLSGEKTIKTFYLKILFRYIINGNESSGWPTSFVAMKLFPNNKRIFSLIGKFSNCRTIRGLIKILKNFFVFDSEK